MHPHVLTISFTQTYVFAIELKQKMFQYKVVHIETWHTSKAHGKS